MDGDHRLWCRWPVVGDRRDGRAARGRHRAGTGAAQVPGARPLGDLALRGPGAHGGGRGAVEPRRVPSGVRPPPRRRHRRRRRHRLPTAGGAPPRRARGRPAHRVPPRRPSAARRSPPPPRPRCASRPAATSTIRRRRCWPCSPTRTSPRRQPSSTATTTRSAAPPSCARCSARATAGTATAWCSPRPTTITASPSASASTPGTGCTTPRRWRPSSSTRRSATSSPSAPTPTASPCSTTSRGATRSTPTTLGELAAAVAGCCRAAIAHGAPFVSGKDSLNNTYVGDDGARHAVPPTLVITAIAHVPDVDACVTAELRSPGNVLLLVGRTGEHFAGSHLDLLRGAHRRPSPAAGATPQPDPAAPARYRRLHSAIRAGLVASCHDVSEGGLAVTVAEQCIASGLGASARPHRPCRPHHRPVRREQRTLRRRGRARRRGRLLRAGR